jgi:hypothetical protein
MDQGFASADGKGRHTWNKIETDRFSENAARLFCQGCVIPDGLNFLSPPGGMHADLP